MISVKTFRWVALIEATTFLMLIVASVIKHTGGSEVGVQTLGPIHGVFFMAYVGLALMLREAQKWSGRTTAIIVVAGMVPFGGYVVDRWLVKNVVAT